MEQTTEMRTLTTVVADMRDPTLSSLCDVSFHLLTHPSPTPQPPIHSSRLLLASWSNYLRQLFLHSPHTKEFHLKQKEYKTREAFQSFIDFCFTGSLAGDSGKHHDSISKEHVLNVLSVARTYCVPSLVSQCIQRLSLVSPRLTPDTALETLLLSVKASTIKVERQCIQFIARHFEVITAQSNFLRISFLSLSNILSSDYLSVKTEDVLFTSTIRWLEAQQEEQNLEQEDAAKREIFVGSKRVDDLMSLLPFERMKTSFLREIIEQNIYVQKSCVAGDALYRAYRFKALEGCDVGVEDGVVSSTEVGMVEVEGEGRRRQASVEVVDGEDQQEEEEREMKRGEDSCGKQQRGETKQSGCESGSISSLTKDEGIRSRARRSSSNSSNSSNRGRETDVLFSQILDNLRGIQYFLTFLESKGCEEMMLFWLDVESYRHISWKPKFVLGIGSEDLDKAKKILGASNVLKIFVFDYHKIFITVNLTYIKNYLMVLFFYFFFFYNVRCY